MVGEPQDAARLGGPGAGRLPRRGLRGLGGLSVRWLERRPGGAAAELQLAPLGGSGPVARALVGALAWARGPLPMEILWPSFAGAVAEGGGAALPSATAGVVRRRLRQLRGLVVAEAGPGGPAYRLTGAGVAAYPRAGPVVAVEAAVTAALLAAVPRRDGNRDWAAAPPYVRSYLAAHAAAAGMLAAVVAEPGFLAAADPAVLGPLLGLQVPELRQVGRVYRRARPVLTGDVAANAAALAEAAAALGVSETLPAPGVRPRYRTASAVTRGDESLLAITGHTGDVSALALARHRDGRLLLASGGQDGTVRLWDPLTGDPAARLLGLARPKDLDFPGD